MKPNKLIRVWKIQARIMWEYEDEDIIIEVEAETEDQAKNILLDNFGYISFPKSNKLNESYFITK